MAQNNKDSIVRLAHSVFTSKVSRNSISNLPILNELWEAGCYEGVARGADMKQGAVFASNIPEPTDSSGNNMTSQNNFATTSAIYDYKYVYKRIPVIQDQLDLAESEEQQVDWLMGEQSSAADSMLYSVELQLQSDGTYSSGKSFDGLLGAISKTPTQGVFGAIDRSVEPRWRNLALNSLDPASSLPDTGKPSSVANITLRFQHIISALTLNRTSPTHIFCSPDIYAMFLASEEAKQRITNVGDGTVQVGYQRVNYQGVRIVNMGGLKRVAHGTLLGFPAKTAVALTMRKEKICWRFLDKIKYDGGFRKLIGFEGDEHDMAYDLTRMITPNSANGVLMHKNPDNADFYIEERISGNMTYGDLGATAIMFEAPVAP